MKKYKLLKDWPWKYRGGYITIHAGTIVVMSGVALYTCKGLEFGFTLVPNAVENNPEWFEEVEEPEFTESQMIEFGQWMYEHNSAYCHPKAAFNEWYNNQNNAKEER